MWEKVDDETLEILKQQKAFEDETAKKLGPLYTSATNPFVRIFIHRIILDTMKHSDIYQTLIELNQRVALGEIDRKKMSEELTTHIKNESIMLDKACMHVISNRTTRLSPKSWKEIENCPRDLTIRSKETEPLVFQLARALSCCPV